MKFLQYSLMFLAFSKNVISEVQIYYSELRELNATCYPDDTCYPKSEVLQRVGWARECSCERKCSQFGTCCIDSRYTNIKQPKFRHSCRSTDFHRPYFMIDRCGHGATTVTVWEQLCDEDWNGEDDDVMRIVPVTSIYTSITYKNYYCLRCHERTDDFVYWNVFMDVSDGAGDDLQTKDDGLTYSSADNTWVVPVINVTTTTTVPVDLTFDVPNEIWSLAEPCYSDVISLCRDEWYDDTIRDKCNAYSATIYIKRDGFTLTYKNPHCALCNFEYLNETVCKYEYEGEERVYGYVPPAYGGYGGFAGGSYGYGCKRRISFKNLLHNPTDCGVNQIWDPKFEKCKTLSCIVPGYVVKGDKCIPP